MILEFATHFRAEVEPRYWEDADINGVCDSDGTLIPLRDGDKWIIRIDLANGRICDWPEGVSAKIHYKVCDAGAYWLESRSGVRLAALKDGYVPTAYLCPEGDGFGDYIIMNVDSDGTIRNYQEPDHQKWNWKPLLNLAQSQASIDILSERSRQVEKEGWSISQDDAYPDGTLARAAASYAIWRDGNIFLARLARRLWPFPGDFLKPKSQRHNYVRAGALILAEIEKIDRQGSALATAISQNKGSV